MIVEGRKRDAVANALLALSFTANAAQSPESFVTSGHKAAPGTQLMTRMMDKRKEADRNLDSGRVSHPARNRKKKTFKEFVEEIELLESSSGERGTRRLPSRGPSSDKWERNKQRNVSSSNAALKKAGFKRSTKYMTGTKGRPTKWTETSTSSHHGTETGTYANQSDYASRSVTKRGATSTRVSKLKRIRTQLGGDRTSRPVHDVAVNKKRTYDDTPSSTMTKGRSFRKEVTKGVPDNLKKAGANPGDIVTSTPTSGSRSRMYGKTHNTKTDSRTGITVNRVRKESVEEAYLTEKTKTFSSREEGEKHHGGTPKGYYWNNAGSTENPSFDIVEGSRRNTGLRGLKYGLGDSKSDAISKGLRFFKGKDGRTREIRNYGSQSKPSGRVVDYENETIRRTKRKQRLHDVTPSEHQDHKKYAKKLAHASKRGMDLHHMTPVAKSVKLKASMSDSEWKQRIKDDEKKGIYHGNHPRNLALAKRQGESGPGISHHGTIHTRRRQNMSWKDLSKKIKKVRQDTRKRKQRQLQKN